MPHIFHFLILIFNTQKNSLTWKNFSHFPAHIPFFFFSIDPTEHDNLREHAGL